MFRLLQRLHRPRRPRLRLQVEALESRRVLADGDPDPAFGPGFGFGINLDDDAVARDVAIRPDGKIVILGTWSGGMSLVRLNSDGSFDTNFGSGGKRFVTLPGASVDSLLLQPDGKLLVCGTKNNGGIVDPLVARLNPDGTLDASFDDDGYLSWRFAPNASLNVRGSALQPDGKIVIGGSLGFSVKADFGVVRLNADGSLDTSFGNGGTQTVAFNLIANGDDFLTDLALQPDGKIVMAGDAAKGLNQSDVAVARLTASGQLDPAFDGDGKLTFSFGQAGREHNLGTALAIQYNGKIVIGGSVDSGASNSLTVAARLKSDGSFDTTFDGDGRKVVDIPNSRAYDVAIQHDGKVLLAGTMPGPEDFDFAFIRLSPDGSLDTTFSGDGAASYDFNDFLYFSSDGVNSVVYQADGKIVGVGSSTLSNAEHDSEYAVVRLQSTPPPPATTTTLTASPLFPSFGQSVTLTANVSPAAASGTVTFLDDDLTLATVPFTGGVAIFSSSDLGIGTHTITARYEGNAAYGFSTSAARTITVTTVSTVTSLSVPPSPVFLGEDVVLKATVTPAGAAGLVRFLEGTTTLGTAPLIGGMATFTAQDLGAGSHTIVARYEGDAVHTVSTSASQTVTLTAIPTTTTLVVPSAPLLFGQDVVLSATVAPVGAGGLVRFLEGTTTLGTAPLIGGTATFTAHDLDAKSHAIVARYEGDAVHASSTSVPRTVTITSIPTTVSLTGSASTSAFGRTLTFTADVTPGNATGPVRFLDGEDFLGLIYLDTGRSILEVNTLAVGTHVITAHFLGTVNFLASDAGPWTVTVERAETAVTVSGPADPIAFGQAVTLRATVAANDVTPDGSVTFLEGDVVLGSVALIEGSAELVVNDLTIGSHRIEARYEGNADFFANFAVPHTVEVVPAPTTTALDPIVSPVAFGQSIVLRATTTASPSSGPLTGTVTFLDGSTVLGSVPLTDGSASLNVVGPVLGDHPFSARYDGDFHHGPSASNAQSVMVRAASSTLLMALGSPISLGQPIDVSARVTSAGGTPTGSVVFLADSIIIGFAPLLEGVASLRASNLALGSHTLTARYDPGTAPFFPSTSEPRVLVVERPATITTLTVPAGPLTAGQSLTVSATVSANTGTPSGSLVFLDGSTVLGSVALASGAANLVISALAVGSHTLTARYEPGGAVFLASLSQTQTVVVEAPPPVIASTTTTLNAPAGPIALGQSVTLTASVTSGAGVPSGILIFLDGSTALGSAVLSGGVATLTVSGLTVGNHAFETRYEGSDGFAPSRSETRPLTVNAPPLTTILGATTTSARQGALTSIVLKFSGPLDPLSAAGLGGYSLAYAGRDRKFGTKDDVKIRLASARYEASTSTLTLTPRGRTTLTGTARLVVDGPRDPSGRFLDGNRDGTSGGAFFVMIPKRGIRR